MKHIILIIFGLLLSFPAGAVIPSAQQLSSQLQMNCLTRPNGNECLRILKETTAEMAVTYSKQFGPAGDVTARDPQYAADAKQFISEYCGPIVNTNHYPLKTEQDKIFLITDVTNNVDQCLKGLRATKAEDKTGHVKIGEDSITVLYYYNVCLRGNLDPKAAEECKYIATQQR
ncbi:MAG: hypothetical protein CMH30_00100 [Micavibrio sp.]|nr:hypothetical protein [Micavibrio sp.]|tara:strand:- start:1360 stop:1878 length:519 start_codon:yes stop_codon:yes gene_type:complete